MDHPNFNRNIKNNWKVLTTSLKQGYAATLVSLAWLQTQKISGADLMVALFGTMLICSYVLWIMLEFKIVHSSSEDPFTHDKYFPIMVFSCFGLAIMTFLGTLTFQVYNEIVAWSLNSAMLLAFIVYAGMKREDIQRTRVFPYRADV